MMIFGRLHELLELVVRQITGSPASRYRPELHYMRGPGPACARHDPSSTTPRGTKTDQRSPG